MNEDSTKQIDLLCSLQEAYQSAIDVRRLLEQIASRCNSGEQLQDQPINSSSEIAKAILHIHSTLKRQVAAVSTQLTALEDTKYAPNLFID